MIVGQLNLFCRLSKCAGYVVSIDDLEREDEAHDEPSTVIPSPEYMPTPARQAVKTGVLPLSDVKHIAEELLINRDALLSIVSFDLPSQPRMIFAPDHVLTLGIQRLEVSVTEVEAICVRLAGGISPAAIDRAVELRMGAIERKETAAGKFSHRRFSEAVDAYAKAKSGLPKHLVSEAEQRQQKGAC